MRSRLEQARGDAQGAEASHARAREIVRGLVESIYQPEIRRAFEGVAEVREALGVTEMI